MRDFASPRAVSNARRERDADANDGRNRRRHDDLDAQLVRRRRRRRSRDACSNIVPIGASPETYQPTPQDVGDARRRADARRKRRRPGNVARANDLQRRGREGSARRRRQPTGLPVKNENPHLWMDPQYAQALRREDSRRAGRRRSRARRRVPRQRIGRTTRKLDRAAKSRSQARSTRSRRQSA